MISPEVISACEEFVRQELAGDYTGHDYFHIQRVRKVAAKLAAEEGADPLVVDLAALLHDVRDYKFSGSEEAGPLAAREFLLSQGVDLQTSESVADIISKVSFKGAQVDDYPLAIEGQCVRDADRVDALGAIGIARAFAFGGHNQQPLHDPSLEPVFHESSEAYRQKVCSTVNHFYEKLLLLEERIETRSGRSLAKRRTQLMRDYLSAFYREWNGEDF